ncbi:hypothetical protein EON81_08230 [bacterium]|nr:MAG: hypothetical protein EON81_08230 [bacterium]
MKSTLLVALSFVAAAASAQNANLWWNQSTGTNDVADQTIATAVDASANVFVLSSVANAGNRDVRLVKYDNKGIQIWSQTVDTSLTDAPAAMAIDTLGNPVVVGSTAAGATTNLLLIKYNGVIGVPSVYSKSSPVSPFTGAYRGLGVAINPTDNSIAISGSIFQAGQDKPYVVKYSADGSTLQWFSGLTSRSGAFSYISVNPTSNRIYVAGNLTSASSVVVGYLPITGGAYTVEIPTAASPTYERLTKAIFLGDRIIWNGFSTTDITGASGIRTAYGQHDFSATPGGSTFTEAAASGYVGTDVAVDPATGELAFQFTNPAVGTDINLMTVDSSTDTFIPGFVYSHTGYGIGVAPVTDGYFTSFSQQLGVQSAFLLKSGSGVVSATEAGPGTLGSTANGVPTSLHRAVGSFERAAVIGGASATGARVHSFSYLAGPDDARRIKEDNALTLNVLANDPGFGPKTAVTNVGPSNAASYNLASDGTLNYTPTADWYGVDTITYDEYVNGVYFATRTVTITVLSVREAPTAVMDEVGTVPYGITTPLMLLLNDINPDAPQNPTRYLSATQPSNGKVVISADRTTLTIRANTGQQGQPFSFSYTIQNGSGFTSTTTVTGVFGG